MEAAIIESIFWSFAISDLTKHHFPNMLRSFIALGAIIAASAAARAPNTADGAVDDGGSAAFRALPHLATPLYSNAEQQPLFSKAAIQRAKESGPIDWVLKGAVTPAISQGRCGTCAQFSATEDIEAQWFLSGHPLTPLAVQEMIDCSSYTGPYGMGWVADIHKGIAKATEYPMANHSDPTLVR